MSGVDDYRERAGELVARMDRPDDVTSKVMRDNGLAVVGLGVA